MNIDKLLIIITLIIIIFIILIQHKEHLTETNDKTTTLDALNNITNLISNDKITSKDLEITNNANINNNIKSKSGNIDKINCKEIEVDKLTSINKYIKLNDTKIYIGPITIYYYHNDKDENQTIFGIIYIYNNECILNNVTLLIHTTKTSSFYIKYISDGINNYYPYKESDNRGGGFVNIGIAHQLTWMYFQGALACDKSGNYKLKAFFGYDKKDDVLFQERQWYYLSFNDIRFKLTK